MKSSLLPNARLFALSTLATIALTFTPQISAQTAGYYFTKTTGASIVAGTTDTGNHTDDFPLTTISLPFPVAFYDQTFTSALVSANGYIVFTGAGSYDFCIPTGSANNLILPYAVDLYTAGSGAGQGIFTSISGSAPNRIFNIEWRAQHCCNPNAAPNYNFEIRLYENGAEIDFIYGSLANGIEGGIGVQRDTGSAFTRPVRCDNGFRPASGTQYIFVPTEIALLSNSISAINNVNFNGQVATFTTQRNGAAAGDFTATIDWGDNTSSAGTVSGNGTFVLSGSHTYSSPGPATYNVTVAVTDTISFANDTNAAFVNDEVITVTGNEIHETPGNNFNTTVATFTVNRSNAAAGDFTAIIDWGDSTSSAGTVSGGPGFGTYSVTGSHTYASGDIFTVTTTITDTVDNAQGSGQGLAGGCLTPPAGMVGWWPGDGNAKDIQSGNNGTIHNGVAFATGEVGKAFSLDGVDDYVSIPDSPLLNYTDFTYDAWIAPDPNSPSGDNYIICKGVNGTYLPLIYISGNNGSQYWRVIIDGGTLLGGTVTYGFQHVAVTRQGNTGKLYVDGVLVDTETVGTTAAGGYQLALGKIIDFPSNLFKGRIDELEIFNVALSDSDIQTLYNAADFGKCKPTCVAPPSGLVSWWTGDNTSIDIQSGNNLSLGGATFVPGEVGQAFNFDGTQAASAGLPSNLNITGNQVTIDGWVNLNATQSQGVFFGKSESGQNDYALFMLSSQLAACIKTSNGFEHFLYTNSNPSYPNGYVPPNGQWTHIALTYDGSNETIYVNGAVIAQQSVSGNIRGDNVNFWVGGRSDNLRINAAIDEVEVFNRALGSDEILAIYNAGTAGKCKTVRFFVSNENSNTIDEFDDAGNYAAQFAPVFPNFGIPAGLSFDSTGNLTVNYQLSPQKIRNGPHWLSGTSTVQKFDPLGNPTFFADVGFPQGNVFDPNGNLYVAEYSDNDIREFDPSANGSVFVDSNSGLSGPFGVAFNPTLSLLFVSNEDAGTVLGFDQSKTQQQGYSGFNSPAGLAFDINGNLYVAEEGGGDIMKIDTAGSATTFASVGNNPKGLVFDLNGNLYSANYGDSTISKIDPDGNSSLFATSGLNQPTFIAAKEISPTAACIQFYPPNYSVNESDGSVTLTVTRNGDVSGGSTVQYATGDGTAIGGTDYTAVSDVLSFGANETSKTIQVSFLEGNPAQEDNEPNPKTFTVSLSNATGAMVSGPATSTVSVADDDANSEPEWNISISGSPSNEGNVSGGGNYRDGAEVDLVATPTGCFGFVNWTENGNVVSTSANYSFTASGNRTLVANFTSSTCVTPTISLSVSSSQINEGQSTNFTFTASPALHKQVTVIYSMKGTAARNVDYSLSGTPLMVTITPTQSSATVTLTGLEDNKTREKKEKVTMTINKSSSYKIGKPNSASVQIIDD